MMKAENDNGPNPCAAIFPIMATEQMRIHALEGRPGNFMLFTRRLVPSIGLVGLAVAACPHPMPEAFGYQGAPPSAPSPSQSTTRKPRPAFIRGVHERAI